jgi:hypothetical protein
MQEIDGYTRMVGGTKAFPWADTSCQDTKI